MGIIGRMANRLGRKPTPTGFDALTVTLLSPGRDAFRSLFANESITTTIVVNDSAALATELDAFVDGAESGALATIEVPNARVAELDGLTLGVAVNELEHAIRSRRLEVVDTYGIGYVPRALAKRKPFHHELAANPGVYATPSDCVVLAYRARVPLDERA